MVPDDHNHARVTLARAPPDHLSFRTVRRYRCAKETSTSMAFVHQPIITCVVANPTVSVLLAAFRATHLAEAIGSVLAQTMPDFELLVLDDSAMSSGVEEVAASFQDSRLRYFPSERLGVALNHNRGLSRAQAERIAIINHDDVWESTLLAQLVSALDGEPRAVVAFSDYWVIDNSGRIDYAASERSSQKWGRTTLRAGLHDPFGELAIVTQAVSIAQSAVWRRDCVPAIPRWVGDRYDYWLGIELSKTDRGAVYVPERLASFRLHASNLGSDRRLRRRVEIAQFYVQLRREGGLTDFDSQLQARYRAALLDIARWPVHVVRPWRAGGRLTSVRAAH